MRLFYAIIKGLIIFLLTFRISRKLLKWHQRQTVEYNYLRKNAVLQNKEGVQVLLLLL